MIESTTTAASPLRRTTLDEVASVAAWSLPGGTRHTIEPHDPDEFVRVVADERVSGLVASAALQGALGSLEPDVAELLRNTHVDALRTSLAVESASIEIADLLDDAEIRHALLKGCATSRLDYADPSLRMTGDVDVLVDRSSYDDTLGCFRQAGFEPVMPPFRTGWERRYGKDIAFVGSSAVEIDLHLGLVGGYFGVGMHTGALLDELDEYPLAGRRLPALAPVGRLVHAAIHSASGPHPRLASAADVVILAGSPVASAQSVERLARRLGCGPLVASGILRAGRVFGIDLGAITRWATSIEPAADETHALDALVHPGGEGVWLSGVRRVRWSRRAGYLAPLLVPSRAHLRARGRTLPGHLVRSVRRLVHD